MLKRRLNRQQSYCARQTCMAGHYLHQNECGALGSEAPRERIRDVSQQPDVGQGENRINCCKLPSSKGCTAQQVRKRSFRPFCTTVFNTQLAGQKGVRSTGLSLMAISVRWVMPASSKPFVEAQAGAAGYLGATTNIAVASHNGIDD
jgi:hypothetical protein